MLHCYTAGSQVVQRVLCYTMDDGNIWQKPLQRRTGLEPHHRGGGEGRRRGCRTWRIRTHRRSSAPSAAVCPPGRAPSIPPWRHQSPPGCLPLLAPPRCPGASGCRTTPPSPACDGRTSANVYIATRKCVSDGRFGTPPAGTGNFKGFGSFERALGLEFRLAVLFPSTFRMLLSLFQGNAPQGRHRGGRRSSGTPVWTHRRCGAMHAGTLHRRSAVASQLHATAS